MSPHDARKLPPQSQEDLRIRIVQAVRDGMTPTEAARVFGVARGTVHRLLKIVSERGLKGLKARKRGRPRAIQLRPHEAATTVRILLGRHPDQLRLPFALWTRDAVRLLIEARYGVKPSVWTVGRYLRRWGLTPQKPLRRAIERDPEKVRRWLEEEYPAIRAQARREGAEIHWGDEMGIRSDHQTGTTWDRKGQTPVVPGTGRRFGFNMISTVTNRGTLAFMIFEGRFNADTYLKFLRRLLRHRKGRKIFLIVDGHPVHKARRVVKWLGQHHRSIRQFFLPPYSPHLNPDELLNQDVKSNAVGRQQARTKPELKGNVRSYLRSTQKRPQVVRGFFQQKDVRYAAS